MNEREQILNLSKDYYKKIKKNVLISGQDYLPATGKFLDEDDLANLIDSSLDMWLTTGRYGKKFEEDFAKFMQQKYCLLVNSGSSANLVAFATLTSPLLEKEAIKPGDEIITVAAGFPTTVNPIVQYGCIPVFVDIDLETLQIDLSKLESAMSNKTAAIMLAHTLGNVTDLEKLKKFCEKNNLWLIEDCCDAIGSTYQGKMVGTFGDIATASFYPAHHMTMGEGGAVLTSNLKLKKIAESFRDWGRDCWCPTGKDNSCQKRFDWKLGELPEGYDHKYIYTHIGYNLKATDMQAALGVSQLNKLQNFVQLRKENYQFLLNELKSLNEYFHFSKKHQDADPSWFGFALTLKKSEISRRELLKRLENNKVGTRLLFAGNLTKQPLYKHINYRVSGSLVNTDLVMKNTFWIGVHPLLSKDNLKYISKTIIESIQ